MSTRAIKLGTFGILLMALLLLEIGNVGTIGKGYPTKRVLADWNETPMPTSLAPTLDANEHMRQGDIAFQNQDFNTAIGEYSIAISLDGTNFQIYWERCKSYYEIQWYTHALDDCQQAYALSGYQAEVGVTLSLVCFAQAEVDYAALHDAEAETYYQCVLDHDAENQSGKTGLAIRRLGELSAEQERYEEAIGYYQRAAALNPLEYEKEIIWSRLVNLGWVLLVKERYELAISAFFAALEIKDTDFSPYLGLGYVYDAQSQYELATFYYQRYIELAGEKADRGVRERVQELEAVLGPEIYYKAAGAWWRSIDAHRMMETVWMLENFQNRHSLGTPAPDTGIHAAADYLKGRFEAIRNANPDHSITVDTQALAVSYGSIRSNPVNVFMVMPGLDPTAAAIVVGAHYDTINNGAPTDTESFQPGANDNGSGVAMVLELAQAMAQNRHRATVIFVLFAGEEFEPRFGSTQFVEYLHSTNTPIQAVLTMDMVGSPTGPNGERYDNQMRVFSESPAESASRQLARLMQLVAQVYMQGEMVVTVGETIDRPGRWGDHMSFKGYPAIRMIEYHEDGTRQHNAMDRSDDVDAAYMGRMAKLALGTLLILADGLQPPPDCHMEVSHGQLTWTAVPGATGYIIAARLAGASVYEQIRTTPDSQFTWTGIEAYESIGIASLDANGQIGPFAEWRINQ